MESRDIQVSVESSIGAIISPLISALFASNPNNDYFFLTKGEIVAIGLLCFVRIIDDFDFSNFSKISKQWDLNLLIAI